MSIVSDIEQTESADEKGRSRQRKYPGCVSEREGEKRTQETRGTGHFHNNFTNKIFLSSNHHLLGEEKFLGRIT
ncbi:hypothetical protein NQZ68_037098 [Dissostichus eleginoides]|nr:hypothetical protein NQZ68_037098 [Dissostichus eleginoides]